MANGYTGKILRVDLSKKTFSIEKPAEKLYRKYLGGRNWAAHYLLQENKPKIDAFDPDNRLLFFTSVVTGAPVSGACRYTAATKSPLTGGFAESEAGGFWGPELKFAGYDGIIIQGRAAEPVYLFLHDDQIEFKSAEHLWGRTTKEVLSTIRKENKDEKIRVVQIGPAGEKLIRYANMVNELTHFNGRTGIGAVMGSKNLRAIAVRGKAKLQFSDQETITGLARYFNEKFKSNDGMLFHRDLGTTKAVAPLQSLGLLPTRNFQFSTCDGAEKITGEVIKETIRVREHSCWACSVQCKKNVRIDGEIKVDPDYGCPEYETLAAFGPLCGITDLTVISKANELCNKYGMDTISTGATIAFIMECYERGLVDKEFLDGHDASFGNSGTLLALVESIVERKGVGDLLAEGSLRAARKIGKGAEKYTIQVKGQEAPLHEPRGKWGQGLSFSISPTGADHLVVAHDQVFEQEGEPLEEIKPLGIYETLVSTDLSPSKIRKLVYLQFAWSLYNVLDMCIFVGVPENTMFTFNDLVKLVSATTGWNASLFELLKAAERSITMARAFNVREGFRSKDDTLPPRFFEPVGSGPFKGQKIPEDLLKQAVQLYYCILGWDTQGVPTAAKLIELDIEWVGTGK